MNKFDNTNFLNEAYRLNESHIDVEERLEYVLDILEQNFKSCKYKLPNYGFNSADRITMNIDGVKGTLVEDELPDGDGTSYRFVVNRQSSTPVIWEYGNSNFDSSTFINRVEGLISLAKSLPQVTLDGSLRSLAVKLGMTDTETISPDGTWKAQYSRPTMAYGNSFKYHDIFSLDTTGLTRYANKIVRTINLDSDAMVRKIWRCTIPKYSDVLLVNTIGFNFITTEADFRDELAAMQSIK